VQISPPPTATICRPTWDLGVLIRESHIDSPRPHADQTDLHVRVPVTTTVVTPRRPPFPSRNVRRVSSRAKTPLDATICRFLVAASCSRRRGDESRCGRARRGPRRGRWWNVGPSLNEVDSAYIAIRQDSSCVRSRCIRDQSVRHVRQNSSVPRKIESDAP